MLWSREMGPISDPLMTLPAVPNHPKKENIYEPSKNSHENKTARTAINRLHQTIIDF